MFPIKQSITTDLDFCLCFAVFFYCLPPVPSINLLAILVGTGMLIVGTWIHGGVYKYCCLNAIEGSFALNLIIVAAATYHAQLSGGDQLAVGYTSISIALVTLIGVLAYIFQQVRHTKLWKKLCKLNMNKRNVAGMHNRNIDR